MLLFWQQGVRYDIVLFGSRAYRILVFYGIPSVGVGHLLLVGGPRSIFSRLDSKSMEKGCSFVFGFMGV